jgi:hypothetical protein
MKIELTNAATFAIEVFLEALRYGGWQEHPRDIKLELWEETEPGVRKVDIVCNMPFLDILPNIPEIFQARLHILKRGSMFYNTAIAHIKSPAEERRFVLKPSVESGKFLFESSTASTEDIIREIHGLDKIRDKMASEYKPPSAKRIRKEFLDK